ncbi:MAG: hypothetical protein ACRDUY_15625 [Nitriliruptorales bacterium]
MLQLSSTAAAVLEQAREQQDVPDTFGVRISAQPGPEGQTGLAIGFAESPIEGDEVSEQSGTELYVAPEVAEPLSDAIIDVEDTAQGQQLILKPQEEPEA